MTPQNKTKLLKTIYYTILTVTFGSIAFIAINNERERKHCEDIKGTWLKNEKVCLDAAVKK